MRPRVSNVAIDCTDMDAMVAFWGALLDMKVTGRDDDWTDLEALGDGGPLLSFQLVPDGKRVKNRVHLDVEVPDIHAAGERARALGATVHGPPMGDNPDKPFQVWLDPLGNEFCFVTA
ncbi:VOC family protein [Spirillospora sp. NPDC029432]|uniref:VOC family protein n=1 Tax=Spirillospora sp. NPDC029432 TaxID=3154599 RepID=UPI003456BC6D